MLSSTSFALFGLTLFAGSAVADSDVSASGLPDDYQCVGTFIFGRHNDRVTKPAKVLTTLGAKEQVASGSFYRKRYFGLTEDGNETSSDFRIDGLNDQGVFVYGETYSQCPAKTVLEYSQLSFLQGLYPPTSALDSNSTLSDEDDSALSNGTEVSAPFDGYQYVFMDIQQETSDEYFYIEGTENCPTSDSAIEKWETGDEFKKLNESTFDFYQSLSQILPESKYPKSKLNFGNAMSIFDFMNVNYIHNKELASKYNETLLRKVAVLADKAQWGISYDPSNTLNNFTIGGRALLGAAYHYLNATKIAGSPYINYLIGSYNTMYQMSGLLQLNKVSDNFTGMPNYGATYVFDLLKDKSSNYYVMFSFKNGTYDGVPLTTYPIFGTSDNLMKWSDFEDNINQVAIKNLKQWCNSCESEASQCDQYSSAYTYGTKLEDDGVNLSSLASGETHVESSGGLTNAGAGGIGAGVTIGVFLIIGALGYLLFRHRKNSKTDNDEEVNAGRNIALNERTVTPVTSNTISSGFVDQEKVSQSSRPESTV